MKSPERADRAVCRKAEPMTRARAARQEYYKQLDDRKQQILVSYKRESMLRAWAEKCARVKG